MSEDGNCERLNVYTPEVLTHKEVGIYRSRRKGHHWGVVYSPSRTKDPSDRLLESVQVDSQGVGSHWGSPLGGRTPVLRGPTDRPPLGIRPSRSPSQVPRHPALGGGGGAPLRGKAPPETELFIYLNTLSNSTRPYLRTSTASHPNCEVKPVRARLVRSWGTRLEALVQSYFWRFLLPHLPSHCHCTLPPLSFCTV